MSDAHKFSSFDVDSELMVKEKEHVHLGGNHYYAHPMSISEPVIDYLVARFAVKSVLDVGAGRGLTSNYIFTKHVIPVISFDGSEINCKNAVYPVFQHDLVMSPVICPVDLVYCVEVVEHIEEKHITNLIQTLANGKIITMTHGTPGQGGYHHVNNQDDAYWIAAMKAVNYSLLYQHTLKLRAIGKDSHFANSGLIFGKNRSS